MIQAASGVVFHRPGAGPEPLAAEDGEQRRQQREPGEHPGEDANRRHRAKRGRELGVGEREDEHRQGDGQPRCEDRRPRAAHGARHRVVLVLYAMQLFAVAGHQEQAVVGRDPEHQDDQDRGAVGGDRRARVGVQVDERGRDRVGEEDDDKGGQCDQHSAVDRPEQEQHQQRGRDQEPYVQLAEDLLGVDREPEVAGEDDAHPVGLVAGRLADRLAPVGRVLEVGGDDERGERETAVLGDRRWGIGRSGFGGPGGSVLRERRHRRANQRQLLVGERLHGLGVVGDLLPVGVGETAVALIDDQPLCGLSGVELGIEGLDDLGRLGALRQERRRVVLGLVGQLRAERRQRGERHDPDGQDDELPALAGYESR